MKRSNYHYLIAAGLITCSYLGFISAAHAEDIHVTRLSDTPFDGTCDDDCSLREAIEESNSNGQTSNVIILDDPGIYILDNVGIDDTNETGDLDVLSDQGVGVKTVTIRGLGADQTIVDASALFAQPDRVFHVPIINELQNNAVNAVNLTLDAITVTGGVALDVGGGAVLFNTSGTGQTTSLVVNNSHILGNFSALDGGGIRIETETDNLPNLIVNNSTLSGNTAQSSGGAIALLQANAQINNSTISNNLATVGPAGGVYILTGAEVKVSFNSSTIYKNNSFQEGAGVFANQFGADLLSVTFANTILVGNSIAGDLSDCFMTDPQGVVSNNYNIFGEVASCGIVTQSGDQIISDLILNPVVVADLADNGGPTPTHALFAGSDAVNKGNPDGCFNGDGVAAAPNTELTTDQRLDTPRVVGGRCDVGAYELAVPVDLGLTKTVDENIAVVGDTLVYTIKVTNNGANDATNVVLTDDLPNEVTFVSVDPANPTCTQAAGIVTCQVGTLNPDESFEAKVTVKVASIPANEQVLNTASVDSEELDTNPDDNTASATTTVLSTRDLSGAGVSCSLGVASSPAGLGLLSLLPFAFMLLLRRKA